MCDLNQTSASRASCNIFANAIRGFLPTATAVSELIMRRNTVSQSVSQSVRVRARLKVVVRQERYWNAANYFTVVAAKKCGRAKQALSVKETACAISTSATALRVKRFVICCKVLSAHCICINISTTMLRTSLLHCIPLFFIAEKTASYRASIAHVVANHKQKMFLAFFYLRLVGVLTAC